MCEFIINNGIKATYQSVYEHLSPKSYAYTLQEWFHRTHVLEQIINFSLAVNNKKCSEPQLYITLQIFGIYQYQKGEFCLHIYICYETLFINEVKVGDWKVTEMFLWLKTEDMLFLWWMWQVIFEEANERWCYYQSVPVSLCWSWFC